MSPSSELLLEDLQPFDTILVQTLNSDYRVMVLDPKSGRVLVEGGNHLIEPREGLLIGSVRSGSEYRRGSITVGFHLDLSIDGKHMRTSRVESASVEHVYAAQSFEAIRAATQSSTHVT